MTAPERDPRAMDEPRCPDCGGADVAVFADQSDTDAADHWECHGCGAGCCERGGCAGAIL